jgi:hypothetical protein
MIIATSNLDYSHPGLILTMTLALLPCPALSAVAKQKAWG